MLALLGEAPGADEDFYHTPFVGKSGKLLDWALGETSIPRHLCHVMNTINCRPPDNAINSHEGAEALEYCRPGLYEELRYLKAKGVRTIVALGGTAMNAFDFTGSIDKYRGSVLDYKFLGWTFKIIPTYHPAYVMRYNWTREKGGKAFGAVNWLADFRKARSVAMGEWKELKEDFELYPTVERLEEYADWLVANKKTVAIDTETTGLHYDYCELVVCGVADSTTHGVEFNILKDKGVPFFDSAEQSRMRAALSKILSNCPQIYQNCFYDVPLLRRDGFNVPDELIAHDTILVHHTIAAEAPHDLGYIVSIYGGTPYWKEDFKNKKDIFSMEPVAMRTYNLRDCIVLFQVLESMLRDMEKLGLTAFYNREVRPLIKPIMKMTRAGVLIDLRKVEKFKKLIDAEIEQVGARLRSLGKLPNCFSLESDDNIRWFLFRKIPGKFSKLLDFDKKKPGTKIYVEMQELQQIEAVEPLYILDRYTPRSTNTGLAGVSDQALLAYRIALNNRLNEIKLFVKKDGTEEATAIGRLQLWLDDLAQYSSLTKLRSTYTDYRPFRDGRVHANWKQHGTVSGRLSCVKPNLMNLPQVVDLADISPTEVGALFAREIRDFFVAPPGRSLISADFVNLEAALLAYEVLEPDLISVFLEGKNLHDINTRSLFGIENDHPLWAEARKAAKIFFFGGISYGGGLYEIFEKVTLAAPKLRLTFAEFKKAVERWFSLHPLYTKWKQDLDAELKKNRYTTTELGRGRFFLANDRDILKQGLDFKIQSPGASLMNGAMVRIDERFEKESPRSCIIMQVHDELIAEADDADVEAAATILKTELERPFMFKGFERVIRAQISIGKTLAEIA